MPRTLLEDWPRSDAQPPAEVGDEGNLREGGRPREDARARLAGPRAKSGPNGEEGATVPFEETPGRRAFRDGPAFYRAKGERPEVIGEPPLELPRARLLRMGSIVPAP